VTDIILGILLLLWHIIDLIVSTVVTCFMLYATYKIACGYEIRFVKPEKK
jgi:hypothetical protein